MPKTYATCLGDIGDLSLRTLLGNRCMGNAGIAIAATKSKVKTTNSIDYTIDGVFYTKAGTDNLFAHSDTTVQAADTTKYYALCLDASGTASIIAGLVSENVDGTTYNLSASLMPPIPVTLCCVGALKIVTDATHTFTPGTTLNDAAGITATYYNLSVVPAAGAPA